MEQIDKYMMAEIVEHSTIADRIKLERIVDIKPCVNKELSQYTYAQYGVYEHVNYYYDHYDERDISNVLYYAGLGGNMEVIKRTIKDIGKWDRILCGACMGGHLDVIKYLIDMGVEITKSMTYYAFAGNNYEVIRFMVDKGANDLDLGFMGSCYCGNLVMMQELIDRGVNNWNIGLRGAVRGRQGEIVKMMIERGANDLNQILLKEITCCNCKTVRTLVAEGICDWKNCFALVLLSGRRDSLNEIIEKNYLSVRSTIKIYWSIRHAIRNSTCVYINYQLAKREMSKLAKWSRSVMRFV